MRSEAYPEMASVLQRFVAGVKSVLGSYFLGAYLVGSLATGDFDLDSDVDFLILTNAELSDAEVQSLQQAHVDIYALGSYPAEHLLLTSNEERRIGDPLRERRNWQRFFRRAR